VSAYAKLPALLRRIDALESGVQLCRRRDCFGRVGLFSAGPLCDFCSASFALRAELRMASYLAAETSSLSPFVRISSAC
jgi:hypothetical protein